MKGLPYFKWYPSDAEMDQNFRAMDDAELGFYWRCLNHSWINEGLPSDPSERARVLRTPQKLADARWLRVGKCFTEVDGKMVNPRQESERTDAIRKSETNRKNGATAKRTPKQNDGERTGDGLADGSLRASDSDSSNTPESWKEKKFLEFWNCVWWKTGKTGAWRKFKAVATTPEIADRIIAAAKAQGPGILSAAARNGITAIHPETWLSKGRYDDEPITPSGTAHQDTWLREGRDEYPD